MRLIPERVNIFKEIITQEKGYLLREPVGKPKQTGKKRWSQKLSSLTYTKLPVLLKYPKVFPLEVQWRGKTDPLEVDLAGKTWAFTEETSFLQLPV